MTLFLNSGYVACVELAVSSLCSDCNHPVAVLSLDLIVKLLLLVFLYKIL